MAVDDDRVARFYDRHPINEDQVLAALAERGVALRDVTPEALREHDQDHYGGLAALETLAERAGIEAGHYVVDLCSGLGGPARHLAHTRGCRVVGVDFTASRHRAAQNLTRLVRLSQRVTFVHADVRDVPFPDASFDVAISQEGFAHVPDKRRLIAETARLVRPGGTIAFTDIVCRTALAPSIAERLRAEMAFHDIAAADEYAALLAAAGCAPVQCEDLSGEWTRILRERLAMYRGMKATTVQKHGLAGYERYDAAYAFFVSLYEHGVLGGVRVVARRAP